MSGPEYRKVWSVLDTNLVHFLQFPWLSPPLSLCQRFLLVQLSLCLWTFVKWQWESGNGGERGRYNLPPPCFCGLLGGTFSPHINSGGVCAPGPLCLPLKVKWHPAKEAHCIIASVLPLPNSASLPCDCTSQSVDSLTFLALDYAFWGIFTKNVYGQEKEKKKDRQQVSTQTYRKTKAGTSLVAQWLRIHLAMHETWVPSVVRKLRSHMSQSN